MEKIAGALIENPILFQTEMVKAILDDRKTQTRRTNGLKTINQNPDRYMMDSFIDGYQHIEDLETLKSFSIKCPYGQPGDLLWVRETFTKLTPDHQIETPYVYKANADADTEEIRQEYIERGYPYQWKPSIHMPKAAARIWLLVEDVRIERLIDISEEDAVAEGVEPIDRDGIKTWKRYDGYYTQTSSPTASFYSLWASINGEESWNANPYVWVVKFKVLSTEGKEKALSNLKTLQG